MDADRDRGTPRGVTPPTPPGIWVRTTAVRPVEPSLRLEVGQAERIEVSTGKRPAHRRRDGYAPRSAVAAGRENRILRLDRHKTTRLWLSLVLVLPVATDIPRHDPLLRGRESDPESVRHRAHRDQRRRRPCRHSARSRQRRLRPCQRFGQPPESKCWGGCSQPERTGCV